MQLVAHQVERLDRFLARQLPEFSRSKLVKVIAAGEVLVDGQAAKPSFQLAPGMTVWLEQPEQTPPHDLSPAMIPLDVVYEDEQAIVVNKPRGLATHPAPTLKEPSLVNALLGAKTMLSGAGEAFRPGIVHRLDKDTTGLILVAKTDEAHRHFASQIESHRIERRYAAVVAGDIPNERMRIDFPLARDKTNRIRMAIDTAGKRAVTHLAKIARIDAGSLIAVRLETGRTHQIRAHLQAYRHPVLGDRIYAPPELRAWPLQLHAGFLAFVLPGSGERVECFAEPPEDFLMRELVTREALLRP